MSTKRKDPPKRSSKRSSSNEEFQVVSASLLVSVPPIFASNPRAGVEEMLDSMIMRYTPALNGVALSHSNLAFRKSTASIKGDCPFLNCNVSFDAIVWCPKVGHKLAGSVNLASPDHVALLVHRTFNVSIPRNHIPEDWVFEYGPADNDPEFQAEEKQQSGGRWVHRKTNEPLGGDDGSLEFTVIGLTVANGMLSLVGSLQSDPFSARHTVTVSAKEDSDDEENDEDEEDDENEKSDDDSASDSDSSEDENEAKRKRRRTER